ncbi:MAG: M48 family peptidase, partial [Candidatus Electrothrix sp. AR3]|nr:M48 family peptidase [Candidatus Electrothrix sp. AR3]
LSKHQPVLAPINHHPIPLIKTPFQNIQSKGIFMVMPTSPAAAPHSVIDYVVVHELCHLVHPDHSKRFWRLLGTVLPDYPERKAWLKMNGRTVAEMG